MSLRPLAVHLIAQRVAHDHGVAPEAVFGRSRTRAEVAARHAFAAELRAAFRMSGNEIANLRKCARGDGRKERVA